MASRRDYYFRQKVTESELDAGFDGLEQADFNFAVDNAFTGIVEGMGVSEKAGTPDLSVDVQGPGTAYSKQGERINFSSTQNVDVSQDDGGTPTTVGTPGNTKVVSVFIEFDRTLSDPRIDGNSLTVFFQRDESFSFSVVQGAEATIGSEVPPPIDAGKILLADIRIENGTTQILDAATVGAFDQIDFTRREDSFKFTAGTLAVTSGTFRDAMEDLILEINEHIDGVDYKHPASDVTYAGSGNWFDGTPVSSSDVEAAVDEVVSDLSSTTGAGGSDKVGSGQLTQLWNDSHTVSAGSIADQLNAIIEDLSSETITSSGTRKIGSEVAGVWHTGGSVPAGSLYSQLNSIITTLAGDTGKGGADNIGSGAGTSNWEDGTSIASGSVHDQLMEIISDLASTTASISGAHKVGSALIGSWHDGVNIASNDVHTQLDTIIDNLASITGKGGSDKIGSGVITDSPDSLSSGSINDQLVALLGHVNDRAELSGATFTGAVEFDGIVDFNLRTEFNFSLAKTQTPTANCLYGTNVCKGWGYLDFDASGNILVYEGFNIQSPSNPGTSSVVTINFRNALDDDEYAVIAQNLSTLNNTHAPGAETPSSFQVQRYDADTGVATGYDVGSGHQLTFIVFGRNNV